MRRNEIGPARTPARPWSRRAARAGAAAVVVGLVGIASPAGAHVTVTPSTTAAGAHALLQFAVGHGCGDSPTTRITIQIPAQITSVTPTRTALWKVTKQTETVDPPAVDAHGNKVVQRVASVTFSTDTPLPDGYREVFELTVQLPEAEGTRLVFPTIQTCERGESAWTEVPQDGKDVGELQLPAPSFVVAAPLNGTEGPDGTGGTGGTGGTHHHTLAGNSAATPAPARDDTLTLAALAAGILGSLLGGAALVRQRRRT
ncbi:YcnI family protein [Dactylosporangium sp. CA-152071]|uniref:YcnI family copper-binding membrane protein n=1 Tax=Dactylosporangium sp. CA-152071 TaxID=3239933 RepID=UPI003D8B8152